MKTSISGKGIAIGESLQKHIDARVAEGIAKYSDRVTSVGVVISKESHFFRADITGNSGTHDGMVIRGRADNDDVYAAFDAAMQKIEKQLRRYKRRITNHHKSKDKPAAIATKYVIADSHDEEPNEENPLIIAEKTTDIEHLTVGQAVMQMDLSDLPALLFINSANGRINVVYRRADGNISWVDPQQAAKEHAA